MWEHNDHAVTHGLGLGRSCSGLIQTKSLLTFDIFFIKEKKIKLIGSAYLCIFPRVFPATALNLSGRISILAAAAAASLTPAGVLLWSCAYAP